MKKEIILRDFDPHVEDEIKVSYELLDRYINVRFSIEKATSWDFKCSHQQGEFIFGLWEKSCFELFEFDEDSSKYVEWNFSPAGAYWFCQFDDYRVQSTVGETQSFDSFHSQQNNETFIVDLKIPKSFISSRVQLNCILKDTESKLYYFAQRHPAHQADFHLKLL